MKKINTTTYKLVELIILFIGIPCLLASPVLPIAKISLALPALIYLIWIIIRLQLFSKKGLFHFNGKTYWKVIVPVFLIIAISSSFYVIQTSPDKLFIVVKQFPLFWIGLVLFYSIFSVYPQEIIYREFFFKRYHDLFENKYILPVINVLVFPIAHLFFHNVMVLIVTLIGGLLFTYSYTKTKSLMLTTIEHALYGSWLFTVGMGEMLGFPLPT